MASSEPCASIAHFEVAETRVCLRIFRCFGFNPDCADPVLDIEVTGSFRIEEINILLEALVHEELDEAKLTDEGLLLTGPFISEVLIPGRGEWRRSPYQQREIISAYRTLYSENERLQATLRESSAKHQSMRSFVESLITRSATKQASFEPESHGWEVHAREIDLLRRILRRGES